VGLVGDIPGVDECDFPSRLGGGPMVVYQDAMCHYSRRLSDTLLEVANQNDIPVQRAIFQHFGSDGAALIKRGVDSALMAYPTRYTHSPFETVDESDLEHSVALLVAFVKQGPVKREARP
jgi:putative aminopeptidase FrvX